MNIIFGVSIIFAEIIVALLIVLLIIKKLKTSNKNDNKRTYHTEKKQIQKEEKPTIIKDTVSLPEGMDVVYDKMVSIINEESSNASIDGIYDYDAFKNRIAMTTKDKLYSFIDDEKLESKIRKQIKKTSSEKLDSVLYALVSDYLEKDDISKIIGPIYDKKIYDRLQEISLEELSTIAQNKKYGDVGDNFIPEDLGIARPKTNTIIDITNIVTEDDISETIEEY